MERAEAICCHCADVADVTPGLSSPAMIFATFVASVFAHHANDVFADASTHIDLMICAFSIKDAPSHTRRLHGLHLMIAKLTSTCAIWSITLIHIQPHIYLCQQVRIS
jgi:hypothetical protein